MLINYLFSSQPPAFAKFGWPLLGGFILLLIISIALKYLIVKKVKVIYRPLFRKIARAFGWSGLIGIILWFFRYERSPWLSMRLLLWLAILSLLIWIIVICFKESKKIPQRQKKIWETEKKKKYKKSVDKKCKRLKK